MPFQFTLEDAAELLLIIEEAQTAGTKHLSAGA